MTAIPDITETENWNIRSAVDERWGRGEVEPRLADVDVKLQAGDPAPTTCPAVFWHRDDWNFVVIKTGATRYRCQFFHSKDLEQYGTGIDEFDNVTECAVTLLQTQADAVRMRDENFPGDTGKP